MAALSRSTEAPPAILCLTQSGGALARMAADLLGGSVHGRAGRVEGADITFDDTGTHLRALFAAGTPIIGVCAAGILIRTLAPLLSDKTTEPPVIALAEDGSSAVPLLGGHRGANALARTLAEGLGAHAAVTTAGDLALGVALDEPPTGWWLRDKAPAPRVMADLLAGARAHVATSAGFLDPLMALPNVTFERLLVDDRRCPPAAVSILTAEGLPDPERRLVWDRVEFTLGVGASRGCPEDELEALVRAAMTEASLEPAALVGVFTLDLKADEGAVTALARTLDLPLRLFTPAELEAEAQRLANPSDIVFAEVGCHGVAEGAALAAAGPGAHLALEKRKSAHATVAIARAPGPIIRPPGRPRGRLAILGIGPGAHDWRTPEASRHVAEAELLVGYGLYLDLLGPLAAGKPRAAYALGEEAERCRVALEAAGTGKQVALICSGDAGIYAMAALVWELMDRGDLSDAERRVEIVTAPGISALQAAAARAGAPLGHDFCAISLSDLLTPRDAILRRIRAAAEGDFVIAFYNPVSRRRRTLLAEAQRILLAHRPAETPCLIAANLGREGERLLHRPLSALETDEVDMLSLVLIGASTSRLIETGDGPRFYTPRGYAKKLDAPAAAEDVPCPS